MRSCQAWRTCCHAFAQTQSWCTVFRASLAVEYFILKSLSQGAIHPGIFSCISTYPACSVVKAYLAGNHCCPIDSCAILNRWTSSLLLSNHICPEAIELLTAAAYCPDRIHDPPGMARQLVYNELNNEDRLLMALPLSQGVTALRCWQRIVKLLQIFHAEMLTVSPLFRNLQRLPCRNC